MKGDQPTHSWEHWIAKVLTHMRTTARKGFAVNFMASDGSPRATRSDLYQTRPEPWMCYCQRDLNSSVLLVDDYGLREFTVLAWPK